MQSFNDFLVFGSMAIGSFSSGTLLHHFGWSAVNDVVFPVVLSAAALLIWGCAAPAGRTGGELGGNFAAAIAGVHGVAFAGAILAISRHDLRQGWGLTAVGSASAWLVFRSILAG